MEQLPVETRKRLLTVQNVDNERLLIGENGNRGVHIFGVEVALVAHGGGVAPRHGGPRRQQIRTLFYGQGVGVGGPGEPFSGYAVEHEIIAAVVVNAERPGVGVEHFPQAFGAVIVPGGGAQIGDKFPLFEAEHAV